VGVNRLSYLFSTGNNRWSKHRPRRELAVFYRDRKIRSIKIRPRQFPACRCKSRSSDWFHSVKRKTAARRSGRGAFPKFSWKIRNLADRELLRKRSAERLNFASAFISRWLIHPLHLSMMRSNNRGRAARLAQTIAICETIFDCIAERIPFLVSLWEPLMMLAVRKAAVQLEKFLMHFNFTKKKIKFVRYDTRMSGNGHVYTVKNKMLIINVNYNIFHMSQKVHSKF